MEERYELVTERIKEIPSEKLLPENYQEYFAHVAEFLCCVTEYKTRLEKGPLSMDEGKEIFAALYKDEEADRYESTYLCPKYAVSKLGESGQLLSALYSKLMSTILWVAEGKDEFLTIYLELFVQIYGCYLTEAEGEGQFEYALKEAKDAYYWFSHDYLEILVEDQVRGICVPDENSLYFDVVMNADLNDLSYLYRFGQNIGENEIKLAKYINSLPEEDIKSMASTFTEGYRIGFINGRKDLSIKNACSVHYPIGMERMVRQAILNFKEMGLSSVLHRNGINTNEVNKQYQYDHKDDKALFYDKGYVERFLEVYRAFFDAVKDQAKKFGGPAVVETFGEKKVDLKNRPENIEMTEEQNHLNVYERGKAYGIYMEYIPGEERSFTIISYPLPSIDEERFEEIFKKVVEINTLDYKLYQDMQQKIIDVLDQGEYAIVKGCGDNETDLKVNLWKLKDPTKESIFENCVADVNIPVGEVFTSPVLEGTEGCLHVSHVYLRDYEFKDLKMNFKDGKVTDYTCKNFDTEEENKKFIYDNIMFKHDTLPIGEFAIGTNTTAYRAGKDYNIADKYTILIAEKTGPHFAVGDTCYSYSEDLAVYNPDGKEIVARENSVSALRKGDPEKAYLNCHTDITIPFEELGEISVVTATGEKLPIILNGKFVVPGTEPLNKPLED